MSARTQLLVAMMLILPLGMACGSGGSNRTDADTGVPDDVAAEVAGDGLDETAPDAAREEGGDAIEETVTDLAGEVDDAPGDAPDASDALELPDYPPDQRDPIFVEGCPLPGRAFARVVADPAFRVDGPDGIGTAGDFLLANASAAFVIESAEHRNAYYLYGGILVDAVAVDGCRQAGPDRFQELGVMAGHLYMDDLYQSVLRAFRAETVEVVADGSDGGPAIVRATGTDDLFWLVEQTLALAAFQSGGSKPLSQPLGLRTVIDYALAPDSNVLDVRVSFANLDATAKTLLTGCQVLFGPSTRIDYYSDAKLNVGGFTLESGVPWVMSSAGDGAWAFAMDATHMATTNIGGITALVDLAQVVGGPLDIAAAGQAGDTVEVRYYLAAGPTDRNSAVRHLHAVNPTPVPDMPYTLKPLSGVVRDSASSAPIAGVLVDLQAKNADGTWRVLDGFLSRADGTFDGQIPDFGERALEYRLVARQEGRPAPDPVPVTLSNPGPYDLPMAPGGTVCATITDGDGHGLPARVSLSRSGASARISATAERTCAPVVPGTYDATVTRGFEYTAWAGTLAVAAGAETPLEVTLQHVVDTTGWMSVDTHMHAAPSPDNTITIPDRIRTVAAEGLEVAVATDHEEVSDWSPGVLETGLADWVATVVGQEVTATMPEHMTMLGAQPRYDIDARGGYVRWFGLDMQQLVDAIRDRGASIVGMNHPRSWLRTIGLDPKTGGIKVSDPTRLGFPAEAILFTPDIDMIELMNGTGPVFASGTGMWDYWTGLLNLGHRVTAVGSSDVHDWGYPGFSRTYFASSTDRPAEFSQQDLVDSLKAGRAVISLGAFARVTVDGEATPGDTVTDTDGEVDVALDVQGMPAIDVAAIRIYVNCDQVLEVAATTPTEAVKHQGTVQVPVTQDAHVIVMGFGNGSMPAGFPWVSSKSPRFVTNPIYVDVDGNGTWDAPGGKSCTYTQ